MKKSISVCISCVILSCGTTRQLRSGVHQLAEPLLNQEAAREVLGQGAYNLTWTSSIFRPTEGALVTVETADDKRIYTVNRENIKEGPVDGSVSQRFRTGRKLKLSLGTTAISTPGLTGELGFIFDRTESVAFIIDEYKLGVVTNKEKPDVMNVCYRDPQGNFNRFDDFPWVYIKGVYKVSGRYEYTLKEKADVEFKGQIAHIQAQNVKLGLALENERAVSVKAQDAWMVVSVTEISSDDCQRWAQKYGFIEPFR